MAKLGAAPEENRRPEVAALESGRESTRRYRNLRGILL
jgi:hypothetical protein